MRAIIYAQCQVIKNHLGQAGKRARIPGGCNNCAQLCWAIVLKPFQLTKTLKWAEAIVALLRLRCRCRCRSWYAANVGNFIKSFNFRRAQPTITAAATTKAIQQSKSSGGPGFLWQIKSALRKEEEKGRRGGAKAACDLADCGKQLANKAKDNSSSSSNSSDSKRKQKQAERERERM